MDWLLDTVLPPDTQKKQTKIKESDKKETKVQNVHGIVRKKEEFKVESSFAEQPAWFDQDDEEDVLVEPGTAMFRHRRQKKQRVITGTDYAESVRDTYEDVHPTPDWAKLPTHEEGEEDTITSLVRSTEPLVAHSSTILRAGELQERKLRHANTDARAEGGAHSVHFHNNGELLLVGGKKVKLFQIDGKQNPCVQFVSCNPRFRLQKAQFTPDGREIIISGNKPWLFVYDLTSGSLTKVHRFAGLRDTFESYKHTFVSPDSQMLAILGESGYIHLASNKTRKFITSLKANETGAALGFTPDSRYLFTTGKGGNAYQWDVRMRRCVHRFKDEGCVNGTALAISPTSPFCFAFGSNTGIVNVYKSAQAVMEEVNPKPAKAISRLRTSVNNIKFNHDTQIMAISSGDTIEGSVKLVHVPSLTVFPRWPLRTIKGNVLSLDFSPESRFVVVGTSKGTAHLWKLLHYS